MKHKMHFGPMSLLTVLAVSLGISAVGGFLQQSDAQVNMGRPSLGMPPVYTMPGQMPNMRATGMGMPTQPSPQPAITGNVYQNQAGMAAQSGTPDNVMIILDASDSMSATLAGGPRESRMVAAKRTVLEVLRNLPPTTRVGLRVYGTSANAFNACHATQVLVPISQNNRNLIASKMIGIQPTGMTPISYTVERSLREDFNGVSGTKSIILISDGAETCGEDPCNVAVRMQQYGVNVKINVVGLGLNDYLATKQLRCVALGTKGQFYTANTAAELANSLNKALAVETKVQGTIITPAASSGSLAPAQSSGSQTSFPTGPTKPPTEATPRKTYEDKLLPAAVPIQPNKR